jgi:primary-amine oxidase
MAPHPFADLTSKEVTKSRHLVQALHPRVLLSFKAITLEEPDKDRMVEFLEAEHTAGLNTVASPPRVAYCAYYLRGTVSTW